MFALARSHEIKKQHRMVLVCAPEDFLKNRKLRKMSLKIHKKSFKQKFKCLLFFKSARRVCNLLYFNLLKTSIKTLIFLFFFCIFKSQTLEVIESSSKASLNFRPLKFTYWGINSFQYHSASSEKWNWNMATYRFSVYQWLVHKGVLALRG